MKILISRFDIAELSRNCGSHSERRMYIRDAQKNRKKRYFCNVRARARAYFLLKFVRIENPDQAGRKIRDAVFREIKR